MTSQINNTNYAIEKIRLDKWLWAARFFKTRSLCKNAIEGGKVQYHNTSEGTSDDKTHRVKVNKYVKLMDKISINQGRDTKTIIVDALSDKRRDADFAKTLYHETEASIAQREKNKKLRQSARESVVFDNKKPDKRDRRRILRFNQENHS